jgi:hypothetical protein
MWLGLTLSVIYILTYYGIVVLLSFLIFSVTSFSIRDRIDVQREWRGRLAMLGF